MKKFLLSLLAVFAIGANAQEVSLDFTTNVWGLPETSANGQTEEASFTNGEYAITLGATTKYYFNTEGYLMLGKEGSYLNLPAFDFAVGKIEVTGTSGASASVKQNIYVGDEAVSTETTGAKDVTNVYDINPAFQAAGTVYTLKVNSNHNTQITAIKVYGTEASDAPVLTVDLDNVYLWNYTPSAWIDYLVNEQQMHVTAANLAENITYVMKSSGKSKGSYLENSTRFEVLNVSLYEANSGDIAVRVTSKAEGVYEDTIVVKSGEVEALVPVKLAVVSTEGDGYWDPSDFAPLTVADANAIHSITPYNASYMTDATHKFNLAAGDDGFRCVKGIVTSITEISAKLEDGTGYGNATFVLRDAVDAADSIIVYRTKGIDNELITDPELIKVGDVVVVGGDLCDYKGACEIKSCQIISIEAGSAEEPVVAAVTMEEGEITSNTIELTFTPSEAVSAYYACLFGEGEFEAQYNMFGAWMGFTCYGDMVKAWGFACEGVETKIWKDLSPSTNYEIYVQSVDAAGNYGELQCFVVSTAAQGGDGLAVIDIEIGEFGGDETTGFWQQVIYTPNDQTAVYFDMICDEDYYQAHGAEGVIAYLQAQDDPSDYYYPAHAHFTVDNAYWYAEPATKYHACAIGKNANGEWGELTDIVFTTTGYEEPVSITAIENTHDSTRCYNLNGQQQQTGHGFIISNGSVKFVK